MKLTEKQKKYIDVAQWILVVLLLIICAVVYVGKKHGEDEKDIKKEETYIKIYESQKISELKKKNKALYDSLKVLSEYKPESAIEIRYKYKYKTDTLKVTQFIAKADSVNVGDSLYTYVNDNDTIRTEVNISARKLNWTTVNATIKEKFTIINRTDGNTNQTTIGHSGNVDITGVDAWHVKKGYSLKDHISIGPAVGVGYGVFTKKPDAYVGVTIGYKIW